MSANLAQVRGEPCVPLFRTFAFRVSVSGVTYCNINPESYLSNFRGQCYLLCSFFVHLSGRRFL